MNPLPYATPDLPGIGGELKQRPEDFFVQEIPLYEPTGQGEHVYTEIEKIGIATFQAIDNLARALNVDPRTIGYAGMKDAAAVTRQIFSIQNATEQAVMDLQIPGMRILWAARHGNKLRLGHLKANRFAIKIRSVNPTDVLKTRPILTHLQKTGMPNYFGEQRFGRRRDNHLLGAALIRGDNSAVLKLLLGHPNPEVDDADQLAARQAFDSDDLEGSLKLWPRHSGLERRVLARFLKTRRPGASVRIIEQRLTRLWISSLQSELFNQVVARRLPDGLGNLLLGDLAWKHENGAVFRVEDPAAEQPRADEFSISPTGPLIGFRMTLPEHRPLEIEQEIFATYQLNPADFHDQGRHSAKGARRSLRIRPEDIELAAGADDFGPHITLAFTLPPGTFATVLLREVMKVQTSKTLDSTDGKEHG